MGASGCEFGSLDLEGLLKIVNRHLSGETVDWHIPESRKGSFEIKTTVAGTDKLVFPAIADGVERCSEIAKELNIGKSTVSKAAKRLDGQGRIKMDGAGNQLRYWVA